MPLRPPRPRPLRLPDLDRRALRAGFYSDAYFLNAARALSRLPAGAVHRGRAAALRTRGLDRGRYHPGEARVEMQFFARRRPRHIAAGIGLALGLLRDGLAAGTRGVEAWAVPEGAAVPPLWPALVVRGRYRDFAHLETPLLGVLTRSAKIASNVEATLVASRGKPIYFFPARFDVPQSQPGDGLAYRIAVEAYARRTGRPVTPYVSTGAQASLWNGRPAGTVPHAYILCFLGDTAEATLALCRALPPEAPRVALVDTTNDCVGEAVRTARRLFEEHLRARRAGRGGEARRYVLHGVRADTSQDLRDRSVPPAADRRLERGVTPILVQRMRAALDAVPASLTLEPRWREAAARYFSAIRIVVSGGFDPDRIRFFERRRAPVDVYGIGSYFLHGPGSDYTADVVRIRIGGRDAVVAKTGRRPRSNPALLPVRLG